MYPCNRWFGSTIDLRREAEQSLDIIRSLDEAIAAKDVIEGFCIRCRQVRTLKVDGGAHFAEEVNLREGMVCQFCGLNARSRQLFQAISSTFGAHDRFALLEAFSPLARYVSAAWPLCQLSEYHGTGVAGGTACTFTGLADGVQRVAIHQDMMALAYEDASLDGIVHNDVLEHVPDAMLALHECRRVLRPGGVALFTMPWFPWLERSLVRGILGEAGQLIEYLPTELHGDGLRPEGIYTFHNFGGDFEAMLYDVHFARVDIGVAYDPAAGILSNNYWFDDQFLMLPTLFRAVRGS